jgi:NAD+ diphosphatase
MLGFHAIADPDEQITVDPAEISDAQWFTRAQVRAAADGNAEFGIPFPSSIAHFLIMKWLDDDPT